MPTYRITTLGCRANHAEAREIESLLQSRGLLRAADLDPADLEIIHTCSVTNTAAAKSRHAVRRAARRLRTSPAVSAGDAIRGRLRLAHQTNPSSSFTAPSPEVVVTGCFAGTDPHDARRLAGVSNVLPHHDSSGSSLIKRLARRIDQWLGRSTYTHSCVRMPEEGSSPASTTIRSKNDGRSNIGCLHATRNPGTAYREPTSGPTILPLPVIEPPRKAGSHIRAELRIQDGCDAHCTFCIIPKIRTTLRSKRIADAVNEARMLVELGHKEIVLTGIFIGAYGHETALRRKQANRFAHPLADLVDAIAQVPGLERLRISSMEPGDASEPLFDAMVANQPVVVPHLHLPLQSGSDRILRRMNRQYRIDEYLDMIDAVNEALTFDELPPAITTDIICGFPGETEADFERTVAVAERIGYLHMHVFPFSPRRGTAAARWRGQFIDHQTVKRRVRTLIDVENDPACGFALQYRKRLLGRTIRVILEQPSKHEDGVMIGRCDHYAQITVRTDQPRGTLMHCRITDVTLTHTIGEPAATGIRLPVMHV